MQLTQLEYLIAVEKYGSISRAARELYTSQSSISTSIKTLETELGVEVLRRGTKGVHITAEGQYILENAKSSVSVWRILRRFGKESPEQFGEM